MGCNGLIQQVERCQRSIIGSGRASVISELGRTQIVGWKVLNWIIQTSRTIFLTRVGSKSIYRCQIGLMRLVARWQSGSIGGGRAFVISKLGRTQMAGWKVLNWIIQTSRTIFFDRSWIKIYLEVSERVNSIGSMVSEWWYWRRESFCHIQIGQNSDSWLESTKLVYLDFQNNCLTGVGSKSVQTGCRGLIQQVARCQRGSIGWRRAFVISKVGRTQMAGWKVLNWIIQTSRTICLTGVVSKLSMGFTEGYFDRQYGLRVVVLVQRELLS